jgi:hypothetical protein
MLSANEEPTPEELDELCILRAKAESSIGGSTNYWWERREDGRWRFANMTEHNLREADRARMSAFIKALSA